MPFFGWFQTFVITILGEMLVPGTKYNITERSINGYTIVNTLQVLHSTRDKLEDMDVSLEMSASLKGPTLQT